MNSTATALERAPIGQGGRVSVDQRVMQRMRAEGYSTAQITGPRLSKQLREQIESTRTQPPWR